MRCIAETALFQMVVCVMAWENSKLFNSLFLNQPGVWKLFSLASWFCVIDLLQLLVGVVRFCFRMFYVVFYSYFSRLVGKGTALLNRKDSCLQFLLSNGTGEESSSCLGFCTWVTFCPADEVTSEWLSDEESVSPPCLLKLWAQSKGEEEKEGPPPCCLCHMQGSHRIWGTSWCAWAITNHSILLRKRQIKKYPPSFIQCRHVQKN